MKQMATLRMNCETKEMLDEYCRLYELKPHEVLDTAVRDYLKRQRAREEHMEWRRLKAREQESMDRLGAAIYPSAVLKLTGGTREPTSEELESLSGSGALDMAPMNLYDPDTGEYIGMVVPGHGADLVDGRRGPLTDEEIEQLESEKLQREAE